VRFSQLLCAPFLVSLETQNFGGYRGGSPISDGAAAELDLTAMGHRRQV